MVVILTLQPPREIIIIRHDHVSHQMQYDLINSAFLILQTWWCVWIYDLQINKEDFQVKVCVENDFLVECDSFGLCLLFKIMILKHPWLQQIEIAGFSYKI